MTACSDDDDSVNSASGVSVSMKSSTFEVNENVEYFDVPLQVTGDSNGEIIVTLDIKAGPSNPDDATNPTENGVPDKDFYVTSKTIHIPAGQKEANIEIRNEWVQGFINDDKVFTISIAKADGATIGSIKECIVTIHNIDDAYTAMCGQWEFTGRYLFQGATAVDEKCIVNIQTPDPVTEADYYGKELYAFGLRGRDALYMTLSFDFDDETQTVNMSVTTGVFASTSLFNFGFGTTSSGENIYGIPTASSEYARGQVVFGDDIPVTVTPERNEIIFKPESEFYLMILPYLQSQGALMQNMGYFGGWDQMHLKKIE